MLLNVSMVKAPAGLDGVEVMEIAASELAAGIGPSRWRT